MAAEQVPERAQAIAKTQEGIFLCCGRRLAFRRQQIVFHRRCSHAKIEKIRVMTERSAPASFCTRSHRARTQFALSQWSVGIARTAPSTISRHAPDNTS